MAFERTMKKDELEKLFPHGTPLSVLLVAERKELPACAKNEIIRQIALEHRRPKGTRAAARHTQEVATLARMEALQEAHEIVQHQLLWANSKFMCSKNQMATRIGERLVRASRRPYEANDA